LEERGEILGIYSAARGGAIADGSPELVTERPCTPFGRELISIERGAQFELIYAGSGGKNGSKTCYGSGRRRRHYRPTGASQTRDSKHYKPKEEHGEGEKEMANSPKRRRRAQFNPQAPTTSNRYS
jgi:hypothetical protein